MKRLLALGLVTALGACAAPPPKPLVDIKAVSDPQQYQKDLLECVTLADYHFMSEVQQTSSAFWAATKGGAASGIGAAALGSTSGSIAGDVTTGFVGGYIAGSIHAARDQERSRNMGAGRCLENRGYEIINAKEMFLTPRLWCGWMFAMSGQWIDSADIDSCAVGEEQRQERLKALRSSQRPAS